MRRFFICLFIQIFYTVSETISIWSSRLSCRLFCVLVSSRTILLAAAAVKEEADENCDSCKVTEENDRQIEAEMAVAEPVVVVK